MVRVSFARPITVMSQPFARSFMTLLDVSWISVVRFRFVDPVGAGVSWIESIANVRTMVGG